jgi:hypothetical protein
VAGFVGRGERGSRFVANLDPGHPLSPPDRVHERCQAVFNHAVNARDAGVAKHFCEVAHDRSLFPFVRPVMGWLSRGTRPLASRRFPIFVGGDDQSTTPGWISRTGISPPARAVREL